MKHRFISKRYWRDLATPMGKVDQLAKTYDDVIDLSLGDPDLTTDSQIIESAFQDALSGHTHYTDFRGDPELRQAISKLYEEDHHLSVNDQEIMVTASGCLAMYLCLEAILDDGDEVIIHAPYFTPYVQQIELARGVPVVLDTLESEGFQINVARLEKLITPQTKAIVINTPNNPSGACFSRKTLEAIGELAIKKDLLILSDEIYGAYSFSEPFTPMMSIPGLKERTLTISSFSKDYLMTGWRIGYIVAPDYLIETIQQINENVVFTAPSISQRGALYAIIHRKTIQPPLVSIYQERVAYAVERINQIATWSVLPPNGTFYLWVNIQKTGMSTTDVCDTLLQKAHVLAIPGFAFGSCGEGYIRIACTVTIDQLKEAFDRIDECGCFEK